MEIIHKFDVKGSKECMVIIRYPFWIKFFMKYVHFYFIPDTTKHTVVIPNPEFIGRISDIT